MTAMGKNMAGNKAGTTGTATLAQPRNSQLRRQFPPRPVQEWWPATAQGEDEVQRRLTSPPFLAEMKATQAGRRRGTAKLLRRLRPHWALAGPPSGGLGNSGPPAG